MLVQFTIGTETAAIRISEDLMAELYPGQATDREKVLALRKAVKASLAIQYFHQTDSSLGAGVQAVSSHVTDVD